jgi:ribonuclease D
LGNELKPAVALVSAWVAQLARNESIEPALLATKADIVDFLSGFTDSRLNKGWRRDLVGTRIHSLVNGETALAFDRETGLILEPRTV